MLKPASPPNHLAIIMDGNRRWAYKRNKSTRVGHESGSQVIDNIARRAYDRGVNWLTLFAFSTENWRRSGLELKGIMAVLTHYLKHEIHQLTENNIKLRVVGNLAGFSDELVQLLHHATQSTAQNTGLNLTIALGYGGQADLVAAVTKLAQQAASGDLDPNDIDADMLKNKLSTADLPAVDLLLRTGKEQRISNFLLWDLAYAEMAFSDVLWPDFNSEKLDQVLDDYALRQRRFGGDTATDIAAQDNLNDVASSIG